MGTGQARPLRLALILGDALSLALAWLGAAWLRFETPLFDALGGPAQRPAPWQLYLATTPLILLAGLLGLAWAGLYGRSARLRRDGLAARLPALLGAWAALLALSALLRDASTSRLVALAALGLAALLTGASRWALRAALRRLAARGWGRARALLIGAPALCERLAARLAEEPWAGLELCGRLGLEDEGDEEEESEDAERARDSAPGLARLGAWDEVEAVCAAREVELVYIAVPLERAGLWRDCEARLRGLPVDLHLAIDEGDFLTLRPRASWLGGWAVLTLRESPGRGIPRLLKRAFDLALGLPLLLLGLPLMALIALAIWLSEGGPVLYGQERVSWGGRRFWMWKFRTMRVDAEAGGAQMATRGDPRRTAIGVWLRRLSLDELPQLWNVARGEMSLVGPRPERPELLEDIAARLPHFPLRQSVPAGMTGWAQIHGQRGDAPLEARLAYDLDYVQRWSLLLDARILAVTLCGGFLSRNAI